MGTINKFANLYVTQRSGKTVMVRKAPLTSLVNQGAPMSHKYPGSGMASLATIRRNKK